MIKLNLTTNCVEHNALKEYLEENVSVALAEKINNGVIIEKDGKKLLNKKDLNGFMVYACNEAKKLAAKGATSACVKSDIVFGWAIHYFEEDTIEGKLYNEDGTEYKPVSKPIQRIPTPTKRSILRQKKLIFLHNTHFFTSITAQITTQRVHGMPIFNFYDMSYRINIVS